MLEDHEILCRHDRDENWKISPDFSHVVCLACLSDEMDNEDAIEATKTVHLSVVRDH